MEEYTATEILERLQFLYNIEVDNIKDNPYYLTSVDEDIAIAKSIDISPDDLKD